MLASQVVADRNDNRGGQPDVSCLVLARPTKNMGLYRQMLGRVLRPAPGKTDAIILDHAGAVFDLGFAEDPIEWTLDEDKRATNRKHDSRRSSSKADALTTCPECKAVRMNGSDCKVCGWKPKRRGERQPFAFAGLWESNKGLEVTSCTIVTTEPNEVAGEIHNRMPVILPPEDYDAWLSPDTSPADAKALLRPYEGEMIAYPVDKAVGSPKNDRPDLIEGVIAG